MRILTKRIISVALTLCLCLAMTPPVLALRTVAATVYNPDAAVAYAAAHATDTPEISGADCANFVSKCVSAGGIPVSEKVCHNLMLALEPYAAQVTNLEIVISNGYGRVPTSGSNTSILSKGDVMFVCCERCKSTGNNYERHAVIYSGESDSNGYAKCYAHTSMADNTTFWVGYNGTYACSNGHAISYLAAEVVHFESTYSGIPDPVLTLKSDKGVYNSNQNIHFEWEPTYGAEEYWVYLWKDGVELYSYNCGNATSFTQAPSSSGNYTLIIRPYNTYGFNDTSPSCSFVVTDEVPSPVTTLGCDKEAYDTSESIYFEWEPAYGAEEYWVYLWKDGVELYSHNCGNATSFTQAPSTPGKYTLIIRPGNVNGFNDTSPSCSFTVGKFVIRYNANGGMGAPEDQTKTYGSSLTLSTSIPTRAGYSFIGWAMEANATEAVYQPGDSFTTDADTVLYAVWEKAQIKLSEIEIVSLPDKMIYEVGENLDTTGMILQARYSDGFTETITSGFAVSEFDSSTAGEKTVTVSYGGKTASFTVTVNSIVTDVTPQIVVSEKNGIIGQQVDVTISLKNNPGIVSMQLTVGYDVDMLTLIGVTDSSNLGTAVHSDNLNVCPYTLSWVNDLATTDYTYNGEIATLTFLIAEDAQPGESLVTVSYNCNNFEIYNVDGEKVWFATVDGYVNVKDVLLGDVNSDQRVNAQDRMLLTRYLAKWKDYNEDMINMTAADVNCDGKVNAQDRLILTRYLAKWSGYEAL